MLIYKWKRRKKTLENPGLVEWGDLAMFGTSRIIIWETLFIGTKRQLA